MGRTMPTVASAHDGLLAHDLLRGGGGGAFTLTSFAELLLGEGSCAKF